MKRSFLGIAIVLLAAATLYLVFYQSGDQGEERIAGGTVEPPAVQEPAEPAIRYPLPEPTKPESAETAAPAEEEKPLPPLQESDARVEESLGQLYDAKGLEEIFLLKNFIQRVVVTIDNLPRPTLPIKHLPTRQPAGQFVTGTANGSATISADNARRYAPYVKFAEALDSEKLVSTYIHFYPLFQEAYRELGYPKGYFNDRLIEVIDHLLEAPEVPEPVRLVRPEVLYRFADPALESLSAGQKLLIRIGAENAARIKTKLGEIRQELVSRAVQP